MLIFIYVFYFDHVFLFSFKGGECFHSLMTREWKDMISTVALTSLATAKYNKIDLLPHTSDLMLINTFLRNEVMECMIIYTNGNLKEMTTNQRRVWFRRLSRVVLAWVTIFNKRRGNEVAAMRLASYQNRPDWHKHANQEIEKSLSIAERNMSKRYAESCRNFFSYIYSLFSFVNICICAKLKILFSGWTACRRKGSRTRRSQLCCSKIWSRRLTR